MPEDVRDSVYEYAWEPRSGRCGRAKNLDLRTKVIYATEAHVLHEMTNYEQDYEKQCDKLYN